MTSTESGRGSQPNIDGWTTDLDAHRAPRSSELALRASLTEVSFEARSLRGPALIDAARARIEGLRATWNGEPPCARLARRAGGAPVSPSLARVVELDPDWLSLPSDDCGRLLPGATLADVVERCLDPALVFWVDGLASILPGDCYVLPTSTPDRCDVLYVADDHAEELVLTVEAAHDGTLDVRLAYPAVDLYVAHVFGAIDWNPGERPEDEALLASVRPRLFDGRESLFAWD